jgi:hypothetical protein
MDFLILQMMQCQTSMGRVNTKINRLLNEYEKNHLNFGPETTQILTDLKLKLDILFQIQQNFFNKMNTLCLAKYNRLWCEIS